MGYESLDDLLGIAEIATVFIGFAVLISVLSPKTTNQHIVLGIVIGASMVLVACLIPILLRTLSVDTLQVLRYSSVLFAIANLSATIAMFRLIPDFADAQKERPAYSVWALKAVMYILLTLCALGYWDGYTTMFYFGAVIALLFQIIGMFISLTINLSREP
ncbi:MAG: hypothetical protein AAGG55_11170 [Pseudomonadota bacterium]